MKLNKILILTGILVFLLVLSTIGVSASHDYRSRPYYMDSYAYGDNFYDLDYNSNNRDFGDFKTNDFRYGIGYDVGLRYRDTDVSYRDSFNSNSFGNVRTDEYYDQGFCGGKKRFKGATGYYVKRYDIDDEDLTVSEYWCGDPRVRVNRVSNEGFRTDQNYDRTLNDRSVSGDFWFSNDEFVSSRDDRFGYDYSESVKLREINGVAGRGTRIILNPRRY